MNAAASSAQVPAAPRIIYRSNVDRIRRDFSQLYPALMEDIRVGNMLIVEGP
jgi:hypothetical protein